MAHKNVKMQRTIFCETLIQSSSYQSGGFVDTYCLYGRQSLSPLSLQLPALSSPPVSAGVSGMGPKCLRPHTLCPLVWRPQQSEAGQSASHQPSPQPSLPHPKSLGRKMPPAKPVCRSRSNSRTPHGTTDWFQIGKGVRQVCMLSPCLFNVYAEYIMQSAGLDEAQARIKIAGRHINNLRYTDDTTLMAESKEQLKSLLMKVKEECEKAGLKLNIQNTKIMASGPITSWQIDGQTMETTTNFICRGSSKITADGGCSHEIKRCLFLGRKVMTNLDSILKSRDITLSANVHLVKVMVFPGVMYGCESWTIKKAECRRTDAFELWCWRRFLRVPWTAKRSNQSILKEISPGCSLEGLMLKPKLQYFGHLMWRTDSLEKTLMLGKIEGRREGDDRGWVGWMASPTQWTWVWASSGGWWWTGKAGVLQSMELQRVGHDWVTELTDCL